MQEPSLKYLTQKLIEKKTKLLNSSLESSSYENFNVRSNLLIIDTYLSKINSDKNIDQVFIRDLNHFLNKN